MYGVLYCRETSKLTCKTLLGFGFINARDYLVLQRDKECNVFSQIAHTIRPILSSLDEIGQSFPIQYKDDPNIIICDIGSG